jgi:hypothetical protein
VLADPVDLHPQRPQPVERPHVRVGRQVERHLRRHPFHGLVNFLPDGHVLVEDLEDQDLVVVLDPVDQLAIALHDLHDVRGRNLDVQQHLELEVLDLLEEEVEVLPALGFRDDVLPCRGVLVPEQLDVVQPAQLVTHRPEDAQVAADVVGELFPLQDRLRRQRPIPLLAHASHAERAEVFTERGVREVVRPHPRERHAKRDLRPILREVLRVVADVGDEPLVGRVVARRLLVEHET